MNHYKDKNLVFVFCFNPANIYLFKVNDKSNRKRCEICSKLIKRYYKTTSIIEKCPSHLIFGILGRYMERGITRKRLCAWSNYVPAVEFVDLTKTVKETKNPTFLLIRNSKTIQSKTIENIQGAFASVVPVL